MRATLKNHPAFTFIEMMIVVVIMAVLSMSIALAYQKIHLKMRYEANVTALTALFQQARSVSLSTILINGTEPAAYYKLTVQRGYARLDAYAADETTSKLIERVDYDSGMNISTAALFVYYFPPNGEVCLDNSSCTGAASGSVTFEDTGGTYATQFSVTAAGAYVDVEKLY